MPSFISFTRFPSFSSHDRPRRESTGRRPFGLLAGTLVLLGVGLWPLSAHAQYGPELTGMERKSDVDGWEYCVPAYCFSASKRSVAHKTWVENSGDMRRWASSAGSDVLHVVCPPRPGASAGEMETRLHAGTNPFGNSTGPCAAGVFLGLVTFEKGGALTVRVLPEEETHLPGGSRNGLQFHEQRAGLAGFEVLEDRGSRPPEWAWSPEEGDRTAAAPPPTAQPARPTSSDRPATAERYRPADRTEPSDRPAPQGAEATAGDGATLSLDQTVLRPGAPFTVRYRHPGYQSNAWVGLFPASAPHGAGSASDAYDLTYDWVGNQTAGVLQFAAPQQPGDYELRMFTASNGTEVVVLRFQVEEGRAATAGTPPPAGNVDFAGRWTTSYGEITLSGTTLLAGSYSGSSRVFLTPTESGMEGYWTQPSSGRRCDREVQGSYHWGRLVLRARPDGSLAGLWGYCDGPTDSSWDFRR